MSQKISQTKLAEIKRNTDLVALVRSYGIELKAHSRNYIGKCPFHEDRTPSFVVTPMKGLWHCMGACQIGGSAIDFVMKKEGIGFVEAVEKLSKNQFGFGHGEKNPMSESVRKKVESVGKKYEEFSESARELLDGVFQYYRETLLKNQEALDYLRSRGFREPELLQRFGIGYSHGGLVTEFLPAWEKRSGREARKILMEYGFIRPSGYEAFHSYIIFPIFDEKRRPVSVYGRYCGNAELVRRHRYLAGPHRGIWNREALESKDIVLCESIIDALTFYKNGVRNVTTSYGIEGFTEEILDGLVQNEVKRVYIAYDNDKPGNEAALKLSGTLVSNGIECYRIKFPMTLDANEYSRKVRDAEESFRLLLPDSVRMEVASFQTLDDRGLEVRQDDRECQEQDDNGQTRNIENPSPLDRPLLKHEAGQAADLPKADNVRFREMKREVKGEEIFFYIGEREYRVRSLFKNQSVDILRINLRLLVKEEYYIETFDMMNPKTRNAYIFAASENTKVEYDVIKTDLKNVFREIEEMLWDYLEGRRKPEKKGVEIPPEEYEKAISFLKSPELLTEIVLDFERCGLVGERINSLIGYLSTVTRRTENPLAVIIQSSSSAGKSTLMDAILDFVPEEEREKYSALTGQSLFYMSSQSLKYKVLAISEEEGAERAKYALKILQSEKKISIATTSKDPVTSKMITMEYTVEGPVVILITTTNVEIDEELQNRCLVLTVNEERSQTKAILEIQRELETLDGILLKKEKDHILKLHQNVQRLLRPLAVVNSYARDLRFPDTKLRMRRDQKKYLTLIRSIALLHQFQREIKTSKEKQELEYIEATLEDIWLANLLSSRVFGRTLDELSPQTRAILIQINSMVEEECRKLKIEKSEYRFGRRQVRELTGISDTRLRVHLKRLEDLEYLILHSGRQGQIVEYELCYNGEGTDGEIFLLGIKNDSLKVKEEFLQKWTAFFEGRSSENRDVEQTSPAKNATSPPVRLSFAPPKPGSVRPAKSENESIKTGILSHTLSDTVKTHNRTGNL